ncbi:MAG: response regulator [Gemmatimonadota bacterium]|nr:response regulator [Gemmatimonadota bacterium]
MSEASTSAVPRARLLVADDEPHIRRILTTLLEASEFTVDAVSDGVAALELLAGSVRYDLILLDIMMPGATGLEVLERLRGMPTRASVPVMILTAKGQDADRERAFALGASDFVTKPFSPKKLLARIDQLLAG